MPITVSNQQLKAAGIRLNNRPGGFLFFKVLEKTGEKQFTIQLGGSRVSVSSEEALVPGKRYRAEVSTDKSGSLSLKNAVPAADKESAVRSLPPPVSRQSFPFNPESPPRTLFHSILHRRNLLLPEKLRKRILHFLEKRSVPGSRFLKTAFSVSLAAKGVLPREELLDQLAGFLFGSSQDLENNPVLVPLFNGSEDSYGLRWFLFPFSIEGLKGELRGSVTVASASDGLAAEKQPALLNINWLSEGKPASVHLMPGEKLFRLCGASFQDGPHAAELSSAVSTVLHRFGFKQSGEAVSDQFFDGFYIYSEKDSGGMHFSADSKEGAL